MTDKEILNAIGLNDRTITIGLSDEYTQIILEKKIDAYLKKIEEEKEKKEMITKLQEGFSDYKERKRLAEMIKSKMVYDVIRDMLIKDGFSFRCPTCVDLSSQYGRAIQNYPKYNRKS